MTTMYMFCPKTGEYLGSRPAQIVGGKEVIKSSTATPIPPPGEIPAGSVARWTGAAWEVVEDHRQKTDEHGTKDGGTPYWLPEDDHTSPPRYMETPGPLPEGALLERPAAPPPTPEEIEAEFTSRIQARLDDFARTRGYDGILSACTYAGSGVLKFEQEGRYAVQSRDATWDKAYELLAGYQASGGVPDWEEVEAALPVLAWPAAEGEAA
jgi:hypothetical protein